MDVDDTLTAAQNVLDAVRASWPAEAEPLPDRSYVNDGQVPWDCEQLTVSVERKFATEGDLAQEAIGIVSGVGLYMRAAVMAITLVRCSPKPDGRGNPPKPDEIEASSSRVLRDSDAVWGSLVESFELGNFTGCGALAYESWTAEGPEGGFAGGTTRVRIRMV